MKKALSKQYPKITLIIETSTASGRNIVRGITHYARQHGPWLFHHEWRNTDMMFPVWLESWSGDGFIARIENRKIAETILSYDVPVVDILGTLPDLDVPLVHVDDRVIAKMAAQNLIAKGFSSFGFCGLKGFNWSKRRRDAFISAVEEEGYTCAVHEWTSSSRRPWSWEEEQKRIGRWLADLRKPVGIMLCHDLHGRVILEACRRQGLRVPDEIAVIGVDDDDLCCEVAFPPLSSVIPDDHRTGFESARLLDQLLHGQTWDGIPLLIPPRGVHERLSSDVVAVEDPLVAAAAHFIREHACDGITVDDVVRHVPLSRSLLQRRFKEALERTLHEEILNVKLNQARFLLEQGNMPISHIAEKCGFQHQAYMGAVFKKELGTTPLQYRREHRLP